MTFPPRHGDLPRHELMRTADAAIANHGGKDLAYVLFKYTCAQCGERCTLSVPNMLFEEGTCFKCEHRQPIERGGFALVLGAPER